MVVMITWSNKFNNVRWICEARVGFPWGLDNYKRTTKMIDTFDFAMAIAQLVIPRHRYNYCIQYFFQFSQWRAQSANIYKFWILILTEEYTTKH